MAPIGSFHAGTVGILNRLFMRSVAGTQVVYVQNPIVLGDDSEPQPDIVLLRPRADYYLGAHPRAGDVLLLIEVSDSTVQFDRKTKVPLYARHGIPEVWLVVGPRRRHVGSTVIRNRNTVFIKPACRCGKADWRPFCCQRRKSAWMSCSSAEWRFLQPQRCGQRFPIEPHPFPVQPYPPCREPANRQRVQSVLLLQDPRRQRVGVVARQYRNPRLHDDRPAVQFGGDEVDAGSVCGFAGRDGSFMGVQAAKPGEQRGWMLSSRPR